MVCPLISTFLLTDADTSRERGPMDTYLVFLGDAVQGSSEPTSAGLRKTLEYIGCSRIRVSSSMRDAVFQGDNPNKKMLEAQIHHELKYVAKTEAEVIVVSAREFEGLAASHPLAEEAAPGTLYVTILAFDPAPLDVDTLLHTMNGVDEHDVRGRVVYSRYGKGYGSSRRSNEFIAKLLGVPAITRPWGEMQGLLSLCGSGASLLPGR